MIRRAFDFLTDPGTLAFLFAFAFVSFLFITIDGARREREEMERRCYDAGGFWYHSKRLCTKPGSIIDVEGSR